MRNHPNQNQAIDDYLKSIEATEYAKKRRKLIYRFAIVIIILGLSVGVWLSMAPSSPKPAFETYQLQELDELLVVQTLNSHPEGIVVIDEETRLLDTIRTLERYKEMLRIHDAFVQRMVQESEIMTVHDEELQVNQDVISEDEGEQSPEEDISSDNEAQTPPESETLIRTYPVDIAGERIVGNTLNFTVEFYDPDKIYIIDYGNGDRKRVDESHTFSYKRPGKYTVVLTAIDPTTNAQSEYTKQLDISNIEEVDEILVEREIVPVQERNTRTTPSVSTENSVPLNDDMGNEVQQDESITRSPALIDRTTPRSIDNSSNPSPSASDVISESEASIPENISLSNPMEFAEKMPAYPGGVNTMTSFLNSQLKYPSIAIDNEVQGTVYIQFVVSQTGTLSNFKVVKGIGFGCDEEALRVAKLMPHWIPGEHSGKKVPVIYTIPVNFNLR